MTALDVISLQEAKDYLKVDFDDHDVLITGIIKASVDYVERYTNHMLFERAVTRNVRSGYEIYDYPFTLVSLGEVAAEEVVLEPVTYIETFKEGGGIERVQLMSSATFNYEIDHYATYSKLRFEPYYKSQNLVLTVGYPTKESIPPLLIEALIKLIVYRFTHRDIYEAQIPSDVHFDLQPFRRYASI